ncbi:serine hydrolase [Olivibacter sp. XZL3]|uniref:serine hydrolase domain-containing protein n=1 Tax=Olivibacter sp. XZL3 TaxID=1735116 RepID=UPI001066C392|nr:serine hydrolase domain-containing protein [Olivibacter sp. XZL3]
MNKYITLFLIFFFTTLLCNRTNAELQHDDSPTSAIDQLLKKIDNVMQKEHIPGLMVSIVKKDSIVFSGGLGYADLEQKIPVDSTTQFHLASVTKFFLAMGIQKLIAEGKLKLDDPIRKIAPEIPFKNKWESTHPVRIVHLLEHTSSFEDIAINKMVNMTGKPLTGIEAILDQENALICRWRPGERMSYSSPGHNVLGYILEKVSGMPWNEYIQETLFRPLAMSSTFFDLTGESRPGYARGYDYRDGGLYVVTLLHAK